ncbi:uncharacterized protein RMCN_0744 [Mycolicibacterium novocastrense]|uniref:Uncharacterized protein n=1 Tax=Mycolicibacterium novocastrense TaxID=59813 RepID=A0ABQ0KED1_MYCNV|nr:uncharacterized protein RMCN_0744 [Mycolicibacterium novocastrense]
MTTFRSGALFRPAVESADTDMEWSDFDRAVDALSFARAYGPPPEVEGLEWGFGRRLRTRLQTLPAESETRCALEELVEVVDRVCGAVHTALSQLFRARAAVVDSWAARLYAPPITRPEGGIAEYDIDTMRGELRAAREAAQHENQLILDFGGRMDRWTWQALDAVKCSDPDRLRAVIHEVHAAGDAAFAAIRA